MRVCGGGGGGGGGGGSEVVFRCYSCFRLSAHVHLVCPSSLSPVSVWYCIASPMILSSGPKVDHLC